MELVPVIFPYQLTASGNPIAYRFIIINFQPNTNTQAVFTLQAERNPYTNVWEDVINLPMLPLPDGSFTLNFQAHTQGYLKHYMPVPGSTVVAQATGHTCRFRLQYLLSQNGVPIGSTQTEPPFTVLHAGLGYVHYMPQALTANNHFTGKYPLTYNHSKVRILPAEPRYMFFYVHEDAQVNTRKLKVQADVTFVSGATGTYTLHQDVRYTPGLVYTVPVGMDALLSITELQASLRNPAPWPAVQRPQTNDQVSEYTVKVLDQETEDIICQGMHFVVDHRTFYFSKTLLYRNSLGGLDTITLHGTRDTQVEYERQQLRRVDATYYFANKQYEHESNHVTVLAQQKEKASTGFYPIAIIENLRDLALSKEVYAWENNRWQPAMIIQRNLVLPPEGSDLHALEIEWAQAWQDEYYTPYHASKMPDTCPVPLFFSAVQVGPTNMRITWGLPGGYEEILVRIVSISGSEISLEEYFLPGNSGSQLIEFFNPNLTDPQPDPAINITVNRATVCRRNPLQLSAFGTPITIAPETALPPSAVNDFFTLPNGFATAQIVGNCLANDSDPQGDAIEAVEVIEAATAQDGEISINEDGTVTYLPPSPSFSGLDTFAYTIRKVLATAITATATIHINVGEATNPGVGVFVRLVLRNFSTVTLSNRYEERGQYFLEFYSDALGTVPANLTGLGININVDDVTILLVPFEAPNVTTVSNNITATGTEMALGAQTALLRILYTRDTNEEISRLIFQKILQPGTGYTIL